jgi:hypothetical protein
MSSGRAHRGGILAGYKLAARAFRSWKPAKLILTRTGPRHVDLGFELVLRDRG